MKILGIAGSPVKRGSFYLLNQALEAASEEGAETEIINIMDYDLELCRGCNSCLKERRCVLDDDLEEIAAKMLEADAIVISSPSYFGNVPACLKNLIDRSRYLKMDGHALQNKFLGVVSTSGLNQGGGQSTIESIYRFGILHGMLIVGPVAQPQTEANMVVGTVERDEGWRKVEDDKKAIKLARNLGVRLATLKANLFKRF